MDLGSADSNSDASRDDKCNYACRVAGADALAERRLIGLVRAGVVVLVFRRLGLRRAGVQPLNGTPGHTGSEQQKDQS